MNVTRSICLLMILFHAAVSSAGENLLANPSGQSGATDGWTIIAAGGNGWGASGQSVDGDGSSFVTSYNWCTRSQTIDLLAAGFSEGFLDRSPPLRARESFKGIAPSNAADFYFLRVELRDANGAVLDRWEAGTQAAPLVADGNWRTEEHVFENYPAGVRQIYWEDGGDDVEFWAGFYGALLDGADLSFVDPAPIEINLNPGTYPVSAPAGGVAGILSTVDNPGSTHSYDLVSATRETDLVLTGSAWSYLDDGSDQGTAWSAAGFDDSAWLVGNAELGFGEGDEITPIAGQGTHFTNYFRHRFNVAPAQLAEILSLSLRLKRDDGAVVYLNGNEVVRENLPAGPVAFDTAASTASDDGQTFHAFDIPVSALVAGENVLAVEIHQVNLTSSDASFDLQLVAEEVADSYDNALFVIDGDRLRFAQAGPAVPIMVGSFHRVNVRSTDDAGNTLVETLLVLGVVDPTRAPTAIALSPSFVTEGLPVGSEVGTFSATDADPGDYHEFVLVAGAGSTDNAQFSIASDRLLSAAVFNGAVQGSLSIRVRATDRAGLSTERSFTITVTDVNDPPTDIELSGSTVATGDPAGVLVGLLATSDPDAGDVHAYSFVPTSGSETLLGFGEQWRFLDDGSDLGAANWTAVGAGFDDTGWRSGAGSFGYGDAQNTLVDFGPDAQNKRITTYFRRSFTLANPQIYGGFELRVMRDDGVAVYLNGTEVARDGLTPGAAATDLAAATIGGADETTPVTFAVPAASFVPGVNTLAAEIHQAAVDSSDLTFDLALAGNLDASGSAFFEIVNGNELRTNAAFAGAGFAPGSVIALVIRSTDTADHSIVRTFAVRVTSGDPDDTDGDGLPDAWELRFFPDIAGQDGGDDGDHDNQSNWEEFVYDTSPVDFASRQDLQIQRSGAAAHTLSWRTSAARRYRLQTTPSLPNGPWSDTAAGTRTGSGARMSEIVPDAGGRERQFRLLVELP